MNQISRESFLFLTNLEVLSESFAYHHWIFAEFLLNLWSLNIHFWYNKLIDKKTIK